MNFFCKATAMLGMKDICHKKSDSLLLNNFVSHMTEFGLSYGTQEEFEFRF